MNVALFLFFSPNYCVYSAYEIMGMPGICREIALEKETQNISQILAQENHINNALK